MRSRIAAAATTLILTIATLGCEGRATGVLVDGSVGSARVRLLNALTSSAALDFVIDGRVAAAGIPFGRASAYASLTSDTHQLQARASTTGTTLLDLTRSLPSASSYSVVVAPGLGELGALFIADDPTTVSGKGKLRIVHAAAAPGSVAVYLTGATTDLATATPVVAALPFTGASEYFLVDPGTYRLRVTVAGTTSLLVDLPGVTIAGGTVRTLLLTDAPGGGAPPSLSVLADAP